MTQKETLYAKPDFSEADGLKIADLEAEFVELNGWDAETDAAKLLNGLGISVGLHEKKMQELNGNEKVTGAFGPGVVRQSRYFVIG